jgi:hypothetical protein
VPAETTTHPRGHGHVGPVTNTRRSAGIPAGRSAGFASAIIPGIVIAANLLVLAFKLDLL